MARILVFGASITYGTGDYEMGGWCNRLRTFLDRKNLTDPDSHWSVYNLGISGNTSRDLLERFEFETIQRKKEHDGLAFIFSFGNNDSMYIHKEKDNWVPTKEFENNIRKLINLAKRFSKKIIFVGLAPVDEKKVDPIPWHPIGSYLNKFVIQYNKILKEVCKSERVGFVDVMGKFRKLKYTDFLDDDGAHLNSKGHKIIFETVRDFLVKNRIT